MTENTERGELCKHKAWINIKVAHKGHSVFKNGIEWNWHPVENWKRDRASVRKRETEAEMREYNLDGQQYRIWWFDHRDSICSAWCKSRCYLLKDFSINCKYDNYSTLTQYYSTRIQVYVETCICGWEYVVINICVIMIEALLCQLF